jgi:hypothetical protein
VRAAAAALCLALARAAVAQDASPAPSGPGPIQDNSFLVEEAYNQDAGVVQHLQLFQWDWRSGTWVWTFTQEWPVPRETHQLSISVPLVRVERDPASTTGLGDVGLNYRYQLVGGAAAAVSVAPRLSVFLPTGSYTRSLGAGSEGVQVEIPASFVLSDRWVTHWNAGVTWTPSARDAKGEKAALWIPNAAASLIFLAQPNWNLMLESIWVRSEAVIGPGAIETGNTFFVSPGFRYAWNLKSGLQIVAGAGVPIGLGPSHGKYSALFYLSFEHPMFEVRD